MARRNGNDPVIARLDAIVSLFQDLVIMEAARAGLTMSATRTILGVDNKRISRTWKHVKTLRKNDRGE